jgi:hypothetical protein
LPRHSFDRVVFRKQFNADVLGFFGRLAFIRIQGNSIGSSVSLFARQPIFGSRLNKERMLLAQTGRFNAADQLPRDELYRGDISSPR